MTRTSTRSLSPSSISHAWSSVVPSQAANKVARRPAQSSAWAARRELGVRGVCERVRIAWWRVWSSGLALLGHRLEFSSKAGEVASSASRHAHLSSSGRPAPRDAAPLPAFRCSMALSSSPPAGFKDNLRALEFISVDSSESLGGAMVGAPKSVVALPFSRPQLQSEIRTRAWNRSCVLPERRRSAERNH